MKQNKKSKKKHLGLCYWHSDQDPHTFARQALSTECISSISCWACFFHACKGKAMPAHFFQRKHAAQVTFPSFCPPGWTWVTLKYAMKWIALLCLVGNLRSGWAVPLEGLEKFSEYTLLTLTGRNRPWRCSKIVQISVPTCSIWIGTSSKIVTPVLNHLFYEVPYLLWVN